MTENNENTPHSIDPATGIPPLSAQLKIRLKDALADYGEVAPEDVFFEQAQILDRAFRHLMLYGTHTQGGPHLDPIQAAMKLQNQYRYTVKAMKNLVDERLDGYGKK